LSHPCNRLPMEAAMATRTAPDILPSNKGTQQHVRGHTGSCNRETQFETKHIEQAPQARQEITQLSVAELESLSLTSQEDEAARRRPRTTGGRSCSLRSGSEVKGGSTASQEPLPIYPYVPLPAAGRWQQNSCRSSGRPGSLQVRTKGLSGRRSKCPDATWR
jgi:hypothetical protein